MAPHALKFLKRWLVEDGRSQAEVAEYAQLCERLRDNDAWPCPECFTELNGEQPLIPRPEEVRQGRRYEPLFCRYCKTNFQLPVPG